MRQNRPRGKARQSLAPTPPPAIVAYSQTPESTLTLQDTSTQSPNTLHRGETADTRLAYPTGGDRLAGETHTGHSAPPLPHYRSAAADTTGQTPCRPYTTLADNQSSDNPCANRLYTGTGAGLRRELRDWLGIAAAGIPLPADVISAARTLSRSANDFVRISATRLLYRVCVPSRWPKRIENKARQGIRESISRNSQSTK